MAPGKYSLLFFIILVEGYVVLACELLAIRQLIPFVGSGTETVAIVISAVLLPLAIGYHKGGKAFAAHYARRAGRKRGDPVSARRILLKNVLSALCILGLGLSMIFMEVFFHILGSIGITHRIPQTSLYVLLFLVLPVYLLGQTVPLISNYFPRKRLSEITGRMLFFSTTGSFLGSVFSTLILMTFLGVHNTVIITLSLLFILVLLLTRRFASYETFCGAAVMLMVIGLNNGAVMRSLNVVEDGVYNTAIVLDDEDGRQLVLNRSSSSRISDNPAKMHPYVQYIEEQFLKPMRDADPAKEILIIGAGGFTLGLEDDHNQYEFVDIDPTLKEVAERDFLKRKLGPNKHFTVASARAFVRGAKKRYDLIVLDTFTNVFAIPMETITQDYLRDVKKLLKPRGAVVANVICSPMLNDRFSVRYTNTFASVFPQYTRQVIGHFNAWDKKTLNENVLYIAYDHPDMQDGLIYTDDKNTYSFDR